MLQGLSKFYFEALFWTISLFLQPLSFLSSIYAAQFVTDSFSTTTNFHFQDSFPPQKEFERGD